MNKLLWHYTLMMLGAGIFSLLLFFGLGFAIDRVAHRGLFFFPLDFWGFRIHKWGGIPFWFVGMLSIIVVHMIIFFKLAFVTASVQLPGRGPWGGRASEVRAHAPMHFMKILAIDVIYIICLIVVYYYLAANPWHVWI